MALATDTQETFKGEAADMIGKGMTKRAAKEAFKKSGMSVKDVNVCELHDCFASNELLTYENLGFCEEGKAAEAVDNGDFEYGGRIVVNPSGGLISKGHPLGATGVAQCAELCWQLRGMADARQVNKAKVGLSHNLGLGGAVVVGLYTKMNPNVPGRTRPDQTCDPDLIERWEKQHATRAKL